MKINSICIVGGGSSGWMAAAALIKQFPEKNITVIESPNFPIIGVGESTLAQINLFFDTIGIEDSEWMPACNATYKTTIQFTDFKEPGYTFQYPFGFPDFSEKSNGVSDWFWIEKTNPIEDASFAEFYHDSMIGLKENKFEPSLFRNFNLKYDTAYHMDAVAFGQFLKNRICIPNKVNLIADDVIGWDKSNNSLNYVITKNHGKVCADLFLDCTGFKSLLLEEAMGSKFISFSDNLMNDSAIAGPIEYYDKDLEMSCATTCTAIQNGWVWNTPVWNRIGTGYVYSSKFASKDQAEFEFRQHLGERGKDVSVRHIDIKHGIHERAWIGNVIGIGLSNGFIEPLESTGLLLTHEAIHYLIDILESKPSHIGQYDIDSFNFEILSLADRFRNFIAMHYALSSRNDTKYWNHVTTKINYSENMKNSNLLIFDEYIRLSEAFLKNKNFNVFGNNGLLYLATGMGYTTASKRILNFHKEVFNPDLNSVRQKWIDHKNSLVKKLKDAPTHYEYLKNNIYK